MLVNEGAFLEIMVTIFFDIFTVSINLDKCSLQKSVTSLLTSKVNSSFNK